MSCWRWKKNLPPCLSCAVSPNCPPPLLPLFLTHACSPLIGRLPQVAVELGRAPQKRSLRASSLVSSRCDRKKKKHPTVTHDDGKTCPYQVEICNFISSWRIICGRIAAIGRDWSQSGVCLFLSIYNCLPTRPCCRRTLKHFPSKLLLSFAVFLSLGTMCVHIYYKWRCSILFWRCFHLLVQPVDLNSASSFLSVSLSGCQSYVYDCVSVCRVHRRHPSVWDVCCSLSKSADDFVSEARRHSWFFSSCR